MTFMTFRRPWSGCAAALSRQYHLRIVCIGGLAREWYLEPVDAWISNSGQVAVECLASGYPVLLRRWRKTSVNYRRNRLFDHDWHGTRTQ